MKLISKFSGVALSAALMVAGTALYAAPVTVNFDNVTAPGTFDQVTPGGPDGPTFTSGGITFTGGVVLDSTKNYDSLATSGKNIYATDDTATLKNGATLPGFIEGTFAKTQTFTNVSLDIIQGYAFPAQFTLSGYDSVGHLLTSDSVNLDGYLNSPYKQEANASINARDISYFTVTSNQASMDKAFAIDTVKVTPAAPAPEASSMVSLLISCGAGLAFAGMARRKRTANGVAI